MRRRSFLRTVAPASSAGLVGVAGCLSGGPSGDGDLSEHPASRTLTGYPYIGEDPSTAEKLIVGFEDPTCPRCRSFHQDLLGDVRDAIIEPESAALVWRPYRYTNRAWATPAIHAILEATARDRATGWALLEFYYANQFSIERGTFEDETRSFLVEETDLDAAAVLAAVDDNTHRDLLETAEADGDEAGVLRTPTFHLFRDGGHLTELSNPGGVTLFEAAFQA